MKKLVSLLLIFTLVFASVAAVSANDITGEWVLTEITNEDGVAVSNPAQYGIDMSLIINADGSFEMSAMGTAGVGSWRMEGDTLVLTSSGKVEFTFDGTCIRGEYSGMGMKFERSSEIPAAEEVAPASDTELVGNWVVTGLSGSGISIDPVAYGIEITLVLNADWSFEMTVQGETGKGTWSMDGDAVVINALGGTLRLAYDGTSLQGDLEGTTLTFTKK